MDFWPTPWLTLPHDRHGEFGTVHHDGTSDNYDPGSTGNHFGGHRYRAGNHHHLGWCRQSQHTDATLPFSTVITDNPYVVGIGAQTQDGSSDATVTCTITAPGKPVVSHTSTGAYSVVNCASSATECRLELGPLHSAAARIRANRSSPAGVIRNCVPATIGF